jgi:hypothetical protein
MPLFPVTSKENSRRIRAAIRRVFMDVWDPIGVKDEPNAQDEYDGYLGRLFELLWASASNEELKKYLDWCVDRMGMNSSRHSDQDVIDALRKIDLQRDTTN